MGFVRAEMNAEYRRQIAQWTRDAMMRKAKAGHVCGGRVFGYDNDRVDAKKVERRINPAQAAVVRRIFTLFAEGYGLKRIAKQLTTEGAIVPTPFDRKDPFGLPPAGAWVPSTIRAVLRREDYRGVYVYSKTRKRNRAGAVDQRPRSESEWLRIPKPEWQIIPDELWKAVETRRREMEGRAVRFADGRLAGRPPQHAITNLLAGIATCGACGGGLVVETYRTSNGKLRRAHYVCNRRRANGKCENALRIPLDEMNEAVLSAIEQHALTPEAVEHVVRLSEQAVQADERVALERQRADVTKKIANMVKAIEQGADAVAVVARLRELEATKAALDDKLASLRPVPRLAPVVIESRLAEWRRLLRASDTQGRMVLDRVLAGRIVFMPEGLGYTFEAPTRFDKLFAGVVVPRVVWTLPPAEGTEDIRPEDLSLQHPQDDEDYGRLLERALNLTKVASPRRPALKDLRGTLAA